MGLVDDNIFPKLILAEGAAPSSPAAGDFKLYFDSSDHLLKWKNSAGTVKTIATADGAFANPMTTAGDIIYGGASGVATRLPGGTSTYVLTSNGATSAPSWQAAAGGGGGAAVLGAISYSSGANGAWKTTSSATLGDIDATNASVAVTIPASGKVVVMIQAEIITAVAHSTLVLGLRAGSTTLARQIVSQIQNVSGPPAPPTISASDYNLTIPMWFYVTGLTPGALTIKAAFAVDAGGGTMQVVAYDGAAGHDSPFVMVVFAA